MTLLIAFNIRGTELFTTSMCFDMLGALQYYEKIEEVPQFSKLKSDSVFIRALAKINDNVRTSKLCNFYAKFGGDKDVADSCVYFFNMLPDNRDVALTEEGWVKDILALQPELSYCLGALNDADYPSYWRSEVKPVLDAHIASYPVDDTQLAAIHAAMTEFSGRDSLPPVRSNIYVLDVDNAFSLSDESFCCTPMLLNPEIEKQYRLDFMKVYTHENLHRLYVSDLLMKKLYALAAADPFYRKNERIAAMHNEGGNEALVVAAEAYVSRKTGRRDLASVYREFEEYVDGSLVLAPIIYVNFPDKKPGESLNDFVLRLFDNGTICPGTVEKEYNKAMNIIRFLARSNNGSRYDL